MLKIGDKAPSFKLQTDSGETVTLSSLKGQRVILFFYPKDLTPGCTTEACAFKNRLAAFKKKKVLIFGISKDSIESHVKFRDKNKLNFPLLADPEMKTSRDYGVWQEKTLYGRKFMGIVRTTFVIGKGQNIEKIYEKVKVKDHAETVLIELAD